MSQAMDEAGCQWQSGEDRSKSSRKMRNEWIPFSLANDIRISASKSVSQGYPILVPGESKKISTWECWLNHGVVEKDSLVIHLCIFSVLMSLYKHREVRSGISRMEKHKSIVMRFLPSQTLPTALQNDVVTSSLHNWWWLPAQSAA